MTTKYQGTFQSAEMPYPDFAPGLYNTPEQAMQAALDFAFSPKSYKYDVRKIEVSDGD